MDIVEVRFTEDTQSLHTGHEFYAAGTFAHFYANHASVLVEQGRAELVSPPKSTEPAEIIPVPAPVSDYSSMTVKQLKAEAKAAGIKVKSSMRKADLVSALESANE